MSLNFQEAISFMRLFYGVNMILSADIWIKQIEIDEIQEKCIHFNIIKRMCVSEPVFVSVCQEMNVI